MSARFISARTFGAVWAELNGEGEVVGGIMSCATGENALRVIDGIKKKLEQVKSSLA